MEQHRIEKKEEEKMGKFETWSYKGHDIKEGLKPASRHFQYFFVVSEKGEKRCNYCVWIGDENLDQFSPSRSFDDIISSRREEWGRWVKQNIDKKDFRNLVLKIEKTGSREIELDELSDKMEPG